MAFFRRCLYCSKLIMVQPGLLKRKKYCSIYCRDESKRGKRLSPATEFKKGDHPKNWVPVGSESKTKEYIRVKVAEPNVWRQRSHIVWEEANKKTLPDGWIVRRIDGDPANDSPENLKAMPRSQHLQKTLENPEIQERFKKQRNKAVKNRWKAYREKKMEQYDSYYWQ